MEFNRSEVVRSFLEDPELSGMQGRLGALLASRARSSGDRVGEVWPSQESLSAWLGISPRQVREALHVLEERGRIVSRRTPRGNVYRVVVRDAWLETILGAPARLVSGV